MTGPARRTVALVVLVLILLGALLFLYANAQTTDIPTFDDTPTELHEEEESGHYG